jgi:hypothetical protein
MVSICGKFLDFANLKVLYGKDIVNATSLVKELKGNDTNVCLYEVKQEDVEVKQKLILPNLPTDCVEGPSLKK